MPDIKILPNDGEAPRSTAHADEPGQSPLSPVVHPDPGEGESASDGEEEPPPEGLPSGTASSRFAYVKTILRVAGAGSTLIAVGYIAEAGHDELLGVNFPINRTLTDYSLAGGRFFIDVIIKCWTHPWISLAGLIAIGGSAAIAAGIRRRWPARHWLIDTLGLCWIVAVLIWKGYRLDSPYIRLDGILKRMPLEESLMQPLSPSWQGFNAAALRDKFVCTHIEGVRDEISPALEQRFPQCFAIIMRTETISRDTLPDLLLPSAPHASFSIEQEFIINTFAAAYLLVIILATAPSLWTTVATDAGQGFEWARAARALSIVVAIASLVTLPYVYGKVIQSTEAPAGRVVFDSVDATSKPMQPTVADASGLLIWADDKFVTVYRSDTFEFLHLSRDHVRYIAVDRSKDIIRIYAKSYCPVKQPAPHARKGRTS